MNTPAHVIFALAAFARPARRSGAPDETSRRIRARALAAAFGGLLPDISLFVMVPWQRYAEGRSFQQVFEEDYRSDFWQGVFSVDNSAPLYLLLMGVALRLGPRWLAVLAAASLLHVAFDFPLHNNDARAHFWPLTDWVYQSPLSYWDNAHYAWLVLPAEIAMCAVLSWILWRRFTAPAARAAIAALLIAEILPTMIIPLILH